MAERSGLSFGEQIRSDVAPLWGLVSQAMASGTIHAMKDPTRGGFASAINEMARKSRVSVRIDEEAVPIRKSVRSASTMLGIDPLQVANEGKVVMGVPEEDAERIFRRSGHTITGMMPQLSAGWYQAPMSLWRQRWVGNASSSRPSETRFHGSAEKKNQRPFPASKSIGCLPDMRRIPVYPRLQFIS